MADTSMLRDILRRMAVDLTRIADALERAHPKPETQSEAASDHWIENVRLSSNPFGVLNCTCGWSRILGPADNAGLVAQTHLREVGRIS